MTRLTLAAVPFLALAGAALVQAGPALAALPSTSAAHVSSNSTPEARRETKALNLIEAKGYGDYTNFHAVGKNFTAQVDHNGRKITVLANPDTGQVTQQG